MGVWKDVPENIAQWRPLIEKVTSSFHVPIDDYKGKHISPGKTLPCIVGIESKGDPRAKNKESGCVGLCQIHPMHFEEGQDPYEPEWNIRKGLEVLDWGLGQATEDGYGRHIQHGLFYYGGRADRPWEGFLNTYWSRVDPPGFVQYYKQFWGIDLEPTGRIQEALQDIRKARSKIEGQNYLNKQALESLDAAEEKLLGL